MNIIHIALREVRATFSTAVGWLVLCGFLLLTGVFWFSQIEFYVTESANLVYNPYGASTMTVSDYLLAPFFGNTLVVALMVMPAVSMRLFSEDMRARTLELLLTSPVSTLEIVLGKYLGAMGFVTVMALATSYAPLSLLWWTTPEWGVVAGGYLGVMLLSGSIVAMGMFFSSFTNNQIVALILAFSGSLALYVLSWLGEGPDSWQAQLSIGSHLEDLMRGAVRLSDLTYYAGFIGFFIFATHQRLESYRWR